MNGLPTCPVCNGLLFAHESRVIAEMPNGSYATMHRACAPPQQNSPEKTP